MSANIASMLKRYSTGRYRPATFLERGVAVPFTTPPLLGSRIRPGERRVPELVLVNPAGVDGYYIIPWADVPGFCPPTLHDRAIWAHISGLHIMTPRRVQEVSRRVAMEGFAGRAAAAAAHSATRAEQKQTSILQNRLLQEFVRQNEPADAALPPLDKDSPANLERRIRGALDRVRQKNGLSQSAALQALEELSTIFDGTGMRNEPTLGRLPALCMELAAVAQEISLWGRTGQADDQVCARVLVQTAELTLRCARLALSDAHELQADLLALMARWQTQPHGVLALVERGEWLLDGWRLICSIWRGASPPGRPAAAREMAALVPVIPGEVGEWFEFDAPGEMETFQNWFRWRRANVLVGEDWITGRMLEQIARNERLRAIAA